MMMMMMMVVTLGVGCGDGCDPAASLQDDEVRSYVVEFEKEYGIEVDYEVILVDEQLGEDVNILAICTLSESKPPRVRIERSFWDTNLPIRRRALVYHELGHCSYGLRHNDDLRLVYVRTNDNRIIPEEGPYSLMHSTLFSDRFYQEPEFSYHYVPQLRDEVDTQKNPVTDGEIVCTGHDLDQ